MAAFNGEKFGFDMSFSKVGGGKTRVGNYISLSEGKNLRINLDAETAERVREICGERIAFGMDKKGRILLAPGEGTFGRKMSKPNPHSIKGQISVGSMTDAYTKQMGVFVRMYMDAQVYEGGKAMLLTPNGVVDRV